jgi:hypothetical protein
MSRFIIHRAGAYNLFCTGSDSAVYERALTLQELTEKIRSEYGQRGLQELPERLERAHATGCSGLDGISLADCIEGNRAGPQESELTFDEFVAKYLTLPAGG